jgi:SAM-dependent methyltransferase
MTDPFGTYARFYDLDFGQVDADLLLIRQFAARCGSPILELACGTGRLLLPLAQEGYRVTGVDVSPAMLELARRKIAAAGLADHTTLLAQDMRDLDVDGRFNFIFAAINSFSHLLTLDDQLTALRRIHGHLADGGLLLLDLFNPDLARLLSFDGQLTLDKTMVDPESGQRLIKFRAETVDLAEQVIHVTYLLDQIEDGGRVERTTFDFSMRYLFRYELELLLRHAGFEVEALYGSYELDSFDQDSEKMIAVARRPD